MLLINSIQRSVLDVPRPAAAALLHKSWPLINFPMNTIHPLVFPLALTLWALVCSQICRPCSRIMFHCRHLSTADPLSPDVVLSLRLGSVTKQSATVELSYLSWNMTCSPSLCSSQEGVGEWCGADSSKFNTQRPRNTRRRDRASLKITPRWKAAHAPSMTWLLCNRTMRARYLGSVTQHPETFIDGLLPTFREATCIKGPSPIQVRTKCLWGRNDLKGIQLVLRLALRSGKPFSQLTFWLRAMKSGSGTDKTVYITAKWLQGTSSSCF